jgi:hypothetical protein
MLFAMYYIWAFDCGPAIDPETKKPIPVDIWAYMKVYSLFYGLHSANYPIYLCTGISNRTQTIQMLDHDS